MTDPAEGAIHISRKKLDVLRSLGVLDESLEISPEAFVGYITRLPVNKQAEAMGLPLIILPPLSQNGKPERKVIAFLSNNKELAISGGFGESYFMRSFISSLVGEFNERTRKHSLTIAQIDSIADRVTNFTEQNVVHLLEQNNVIFQRHFGFAYGLRYPDVPKIELFSKKDMLDRFQKVRHYKFDNAAINDLVASEAEAVEYLSRKISAAQYAEQMCIYLYLWRSLERKEWGNLISVVLRNWDRMATGWPDVNVIGKNGQLTLIEVKGKDKLHTSQVFTLLKLKEVLGPQRLAIAWVNRIVYDLPFDNQVHRDSVMEWINTPANGRTNSLQHWQSFYSHEKAIEYSAVGA